jgi:hypothetical protein
MQDMAQSLSPAEVAEKLGLPSERRHAWFIQPTSATTGEGLYEGLDWLSRQLASSSSSSLSSSVVGSAASPRALWA